MSYTKGKLTIWTRRKVKKIMLAFATISVLFFAITNLFFPAFLYKHLAFCVMFLLQPIITGIYAFFFVSDPELIAHRTERLLEKFGYEVSEEEMEEYKRRESEYNNLFVPTLFIYTAIWLAHVYVIESIDIRLLGDPVKDWIHVYGMFTYAIPILLLFILFELYTGRKHPDARRLEILINKLGKQDQKRWSKILREVINEDKFEKQSNQ